MPPSKKSKSAAGAAASSTTASKFLASLFTGALASGRSNLAPPPAAPPSQRLTRGKARAAPSAPVVAAPALHPESEDAAEAVRAQRKHELLFGGPSNLQPAEAAQSKAAAEAAERDALEPELRGLMHARVQIDGLTENTELNSKFGRTTAYNREKGRFAVDIEGGPSMLLKPVNLTAVDPLAADEPESVDDFEPARHVESYREWYAHSHAGEVLQPKRSFVGWWDLRRRDRAPALDIDQLPPPLFIPGLGRRELRPWIVPWLVGYIFHENFVRARLLARVSRPL